MSDHVTVLVLTDDHVCMETMIVLLFRARDHDCPHVHARDYLRVHARAHGQLVLYLDLKAGLDLFQQV